MNSKEYVQEVLRTESGRFDANHVAPWMLKLTLGLFAAAGQAMDALKRGLYYGKTVNYDNLYAQLREARRLLNTYFPDQTIYTNAQAQPQAGMFTCSLQSMTPAPVDMPRFNETDPVVDPRVVHAAFGLATESGEIIEKVLHSFENGEPFDMDNFFEELSDLQWYTALGLDAAQKLSADTNPEKWTYEKVWEANRDKLKARYPDKFKTEDAYNRDISKEQKALNEAA